MAKLKNGFHRIRSWEKAPLLRRQGCARFDAGSGRQRSGLKGPGTWLSSLSQPGSDGTPWRLRVPLLEPSLHRVKMSVPQWHTDREGLGGRLQQKHSHRLHKKNVKCQMSKMSKIIRRTFRSLIILRNRKRFRNGGDRGLPSCPLITEEPHCGSRAAPKRRSDWIAGDASSFGAPARNPVPQSRRPIVPAWPPRRPPKLLSKRPDAQRRRLCVVYRHTPSS